MVQGKKLWNWELRDWVPPDIFGFDFLYDPGQKPLSLGLDFFLDCVFSEFQKEL